MEANPNNQVQHMEADWEKKLKGQSKKYRGDLYGTRGDGYTEGMLYLSRMAKPKSSKQDSVSEINASAESNEELIDEVSNYVFIR